MCPHQCLVLCLEGKEDSGTALPREALKWGSRASAQAAPRQLLEGPEVSQREELERRRGPQLNGVAATQVS